MKILLLQLDGALSNLALMRLGTWHRRQGHEVELRQLRRADRAQRGLWDEWDKVYAACIFQKTRPLAEAVLRAYPGAIVGGTGWDIGLTLESLGVPADTPPDYSLYPNETRSIGFTQRGCRLSCSFCVVPKKEGRIAKGQTIEEIWRGEPWPKHLLLLDNDFFGHPDWPKNIDAIRRGGFRVSFNQGINARFLTTETAEAIASVHYSDDGFKKRTLYTAWDNRKDESRLFAGLDCLRKAGVKPDNVIVYMLIGYWPGETDEDWLYRSTRLREWGARPYPMPYRRTPLTRGFQRWCIRAADKKVGWKEFRSRNCRTERREPDMPLLARMELPLA